MCLYIVGALFVCVSVHTCVNLCEAYCVNPRLYQHDYIPMNYLQFCDLYALVLFTLLYHNNYYSGKFRYLARESSAEMLFQF